MRQWVYLSHYQGITRTPRFTGLAEIDSGNEVADVIVRDAV